MGLSPLVGHIQYIRLNKGVPSKGLSPLVGHIEYIELNQAVR